MSTLVNLLPDIRQAKQRDHKRRQMITGISVSVWVICGVVILLLSVYAGGQKVIISNYTKSISDKQEELRQVDGLVEALTAHQHLASLPSLYDKRVYLTKFFAAYSQSNPNSISLTSLQVDNAGALTVIGSAPSFAEVAKLARALEASNVKVGSEASESNSPYFTNVNIGSLDNGERTGVSFTITAVLGSGVTSGEN